MIRTKLPLLLTGLLGAALAMGCDSETKTTDTGSGSTDGGQGTGGGTDGGTDGGSGTDGGTGGGTDGGGGGGGGGGTETAAIAFVLGGVVDPGSTGDPNISGEFLGYYGVNAYGVDGQYVDFTTYYCSWYGLNSEAALPSDCPDCEFSFSMTLDTPSEEGTDCGVLEDGLGPYGYTGPEVFVDFNLDFGFQKLGSGSYSGYDYDYGYVSFYLGYPYYYWYTSGYYFAYTYTDYYDPTLTQMRGVNGYYAIEFTP